MIEGSRGRMQREYESSMRKDRTGWMAREIEENGVRRDGEEWNRKGSGERRYERMSGRSHRHVQCSVMPLGKEIPAQTEAPHAPDRVLNVPYLQYSEVTTLKDLASYSYISSVVSAIKETRCQSRTTPYKPDPKPTLLYLAYSPRNAQLSPVWPAIRVSTSYNSDLA